MSTLPAGTVIASDYRVEQQLATGGMGTLYVVTQLSTGRRRALKLMHDDFVKDDKLRERFVQEARVGSRIESEHVVEVIAAGLDGPNRVPFMVMELLEGETLAAYLERRGALPPGEVDELLSQLCHALGAAHAAGIVHRDIKPENVLVCATKRAGAQLMVKVLDFGIAKVLAEAKSALTSAMGTPLWMAPEQSEIRSTVSAATDVWPLGLIAFRALSGVMYWRGAQAGATLESVMRESLFEPLPPASRRAAELGGKPLPYGFDEWFARAVERDPSRRYADASIAFAALHPILVAPAPLAGATVIGAPLHTAGVHVPSPGYTQLAPQGSFGPQLGQGPAPLASPPARRPSRAPLFAALAALALGVVAGGAYLATREEPKRRVQRDDDEDEAPRSRASASASGSGSVTAPSVGPWRQAAKVPVSSDDPALGPKDAPVTVVVFGGFQCKYCLKLAPELDKLRERFGDDVRVVWKDHAFETHTHGKALAALGRTIFRKKGNDAFWRFHHFVVAQVGPDPTEQQVVEILSNGATFTRFAIDQLKLDDATIAAEAKKSEEEVAASSALATSLDVKGIPLSFINGLRVSGAAATKIQENVERELTAVRAARAGGLQPGETYAKRVELNYGSEPATPPSSAGKGTRPFAPLPAVVNAPARGPADAPVRLLAFFDFQCPFCHKAALTVADLQKAYPSELRLEYAHLPLPMHKLAMPAANLAQQAYNQKGNAGFWLAFDKLVALDTKSMKEADLDAIIASLGLDRGKATCTAARCDHKPLIEAAVKNANSAGIKGTPSFAVNRRRFSGAIPLEEMRAYVDWELAKYKAHVDSGKAPADYAAADAARATKLADLEITDTRGSGALVAKGQEALVSYKGTLSDGTVFDSTEGKPPVAFKLVPGRLIIGFEEALIGMRVGGKRKVVIPPSAGYGAAGAGGKVPPNATLTFEIELTGVR